MKLSIIQLIGIYLIGDGVISYYHFINGAAPIEQFFRIVRTGIGIYLWVKG